MTRPTVLILAMASLRVRLTGRSRTITFYGQQIKRIEPRPGGPSHNARHLGLDERA
jgi:hypothetical protein